MELSRQRGITGAIDCTPGGAVQAPVSPERPVQLHIGDLAIGQDLEADGDHAGLEDRRIDFVGYERIPCLLRDIVPALEPVAEVDALRIGKNLVAAACAGMHGQPAARRSVPKLRSDWPLVVHGGYSACPV